jgi:hypothetical protein
MRTKGAALATAMNWLSNYIIVEITPPGIEYLGWKFYLIWMFFNALFVPVRRILRPWFPLILYTCVNSRHEGGVAAVPRDGESVWLPSLSSSGYRLLMAM